MVRLATLRSFFSLMACLALALICPGSTIAAEVDYATQIKPLLTHRCYACHGALKQQGGLRLDTAALLRKGGDSGAGIVPGKSGDSVLIERLTATDASERMPPEGEGEPLKPAELALLRQWIDGGAPSPADERPEVDPREHWSFRAPAKPKIPAIKQPRWALNPIDSFIAAEHDRRELQPQGEADRAVLLRRVYLDLVGLPPTAEEIERFVHDDSPGAYERVVDQLLESHLYGERWGRHWMDIWRYSDWWGLGSELRNSQKHMWHWRDWIVESLNDDKGYDQMLREMLAADELYPTDEDRLRATGFLARSYFRFNRTTWLDSVVEHTSKALLGLTLNCSKCHDHKYDPVSQVDYYRFRAIFEPYQTRLDQVSTQLDFERDGIPRVFDCNLDTPTYLHIRGDDTRPKKDEPLSPGTPAILAVGEWKVTPVTLPLAAHQPGLREELVAAHRRDALAKIDTAREVLQQAEAKVAAQSAESADEALTRAVKIARLRLAAAELLPSLIDARFAADRARFQTPPAENVKQLAETAARHEHNWNTAQTEAALAQAEEERRVVAAGKEADADKKVAAAKQTLEQLRKTSTSPGVKYVSLQGSLKTPESNLESRDSQTKPYPQTSSGRRSALAQWLTDPRHPLTARVAVNHLWVRHFGQPLVATVFDFGRKGAAPSHPELLDYLAVEFVEHGYSIKHLHRLMVTSRTYRLSASSVGAATNNRATDPENRYYWRRNASRMEAQIVRDSVLHLAGELDTTVGGPTVAAMDEASRRRSLYFFHSHNEHPKFLSIFDDANVLECYRRTESIVPQQALALNNSTLMQRLAGVIAGRLESQAVSTNPVEQDAAFIERAWRTILGTAPTEQESMLCRAALGEWRSLAQSERAADPTRAAHTALVQALLNHNDFVTIR